MWAIFLVAEFLRIVSMFKKRKENSLSYVHERLCVRCALTNQSTSESGYFLHDYELTLQPILMKLQH